MQQKETQCRYCGDNWSPGHKCNNYKSGGHQTDKEPDISTSSYDSDRKKKKNTCRRCGETWIPGHKCLSTQTSHCKSIDGKEVQASVEEDTSDSDTNSPEVSIASLTCVPKTCIEKDSQVQYVPPQLRHNDNIKRTKPHKLEQKRLKLNGTIKNKDVTILIDPGSTHNLVDMKIAKALNLFVYPVKNLTVSTITDQHLDEVGKCHKVPLHIQDLKLQIDCYALSLKGVDMVLGAEWLIQLGTYATNLQEQYIEFRWKGNNYKLYGLKNLQTSQPKQKEFRPKRGPCSYQGKGSNDRVRDQCHFTSSR